nr:hypothetical protein [Gammaproteobacteria bacterium]
NTSNTDIITDFNQSNNGVYTSAEGDKIRFEFDQTLQINSGNSFSGVQHELIWKDDGSGGVYIEIDWGGDSSADFRLQLKDIGTADFSQSDISSANFEFRRVTGTSSADTINGTSGADTLDGANGNDTLDGNAGLDSLLGGAGDDLLIYDASDIASGGLVDGGADTDTWQVEAAVTITITSSSTWDYIDNLEYIDLVDGNHNSVLNISANGLSNITDSDNDLYVKGGANDTVSTADSWTSSGTSVVDSITYNHYTASGYDIFIQQGVVQSDF